MGDDDHAGGKCARGLGGDDAAESPMAMAILAAAASHASTLSTLAHRQTLLFSHSFDAGVAFRL